MISPFLLIVHIIRLNYRPLFGKMRPDPEDRDGGNRAYTFIYGCSNYTFHVASKKKLVSWDKSHRLSKKFRSDLVLLESRDEWTALKIVIQSFPASEYAIGLKKERGSGRWLWLSNNSSVNVSRGRTPWSPSQPSGDGECTEMYRNYRKYQWGKLNDLPCTERRGGYICERRVSCLGNTEGKGLDSKIEADIISVLVSCFSCLHCTPLYFRRLKVARLMTKASSRCRRSNKTL